jgi:hypothetical protein
MKTLRELNFSTLCTIYVLILCSLIFQYTLTQSSKANAQTSFLATLIGGQTNGVSDLCCNGVVLDFDSVDSTNISILDGEALFVPGISSSYDHGNEYSSGYNTVGNLITGLCVTIESECESVDSMPIIISIGTSGGSAGF